MEKDEAHMADKQCREYSRVEANVPFEYRIITREEKDHVQSRIFGDTSSAELMTVSGVGDYDHVFGEWIKVLNTKLDTIIRLITLQHEGYMSFSFKTISISGGGMSFILPQAIPTGEILEIKMTLTFHQPTALCIYGEVARSEQRDNGHFIAVTYVHMDDSVRDEIIRFVFEREREIIREKRG